ncbi:helix-turn-helix domain-containing protein [Hoyosella sp. YIM 151337]|uniref:PucR family transcriptional regulator n=1 Tax=Hoyosella sp. YIM 151337 TaxID=2992742 RepID=UPI0022362DEB|nr:helix-turn-helix domain-containing protein [Hoyosella sp. YIM 151337]MCW4354252.1 helix-turn-helix domain-containing protein [Hoyosella sp. YIM 151337]
MAELDKERDAAVVAEAAAAIISRLDTRVSGVTATVQKHIVEAVSELRGDAQLIELLRDSVEGNITTILSAIQHGIPIEQVEPPTAALEYARRLAQREVSPNALVRAYRVGQQALLRIVLDEVRTSGLSPELRLDVFEQMTAVTFGYIDWISEQVILTYQRERDHWVEHRNRLRALRIREVLSSGSIDVDAMTAAIRYPLKRFHLAVVVWRLHTESSEELGPMERFIRDLGEAVGACAPPLFMAEDKLTGWAWIPVESSTATLAETRARGFARSRTDAPYLAVGQPLAGLDGFRRSHQQALAARAVVIAADSEDLRFAASSDPGLAAAALSAGNIDHMRVWVLETLGPLASDNENDERLRDTLRVFLGCGSSFKAAAEKLNLHFNSVKYRVSRAIDRRGRPIADDRLDVEIALLLCHWYRSAVLA